MNASCVGGRERKLVDARFVRSLDTGEREKLEHHLAACSFCSERYRRLQLAHRIAALGPERALEEPAPLELERIAHDLGLDEEPAPRPRFAWLLNARFLALAASSAVAIGAAALFFVPATDDEFVARGGKHPDVSFAAYVISPDGAIRAHAPAAAAKTTDYLKLRVEVRPELEISGFEVAIVPAGGEPRVTKLEKPAGLESGGSLSIPGAISLALPPGKALIYVIAAGKTPIDGARLAREVSPKPEVEALARSLGASALSIERLELEVR